MKTKKKTTVLVGNTVVLYHDSFPTFAWQQQREGSPPSGTVRVLEVYLDGTLDVQAYPRTADGRILHDQAPVGEVFRNVTEYQRQYDREGNCTTHPRSGEWQVIE